MDKMSKMSSTSQAKFPYLVTALGIGLMAASEIYSYVRAMMFRAMFQAGSYGSSYGSGRHFGGGFGYGLPSILTTIAVLIAIVGVVWLGLALKKPSKPAKA